MKLNMCMLVNLKYKAGAIELGPANRKGLTASIANLGHNVTCVIYTEENSNLLQFHLRNICVFAIPYIRILSSSYLIGRILNMVLNIPKAIYFILQIFREGNYNLVYVKGDIIGGLTAIYIKKKYRVPFIFDPEPLGISRELYKINSRKPMFLYYLLGRFHDLLTNYQMKKADLITPSSKWFAGELIQKGIPESKLMPYPNGVDVASFSNIDGNAIREKYQLADSQAITYIGTLHKARNLSILIEAFAKVKNHSGEVKLLMVGEGSGKEDLQDLVDTLEIRSEVIFTGQVPGSEIPKFVSVTDIGVSPVPPLECYKISSPLKVFEYMAGGKPVIANEEIFDHKEVLEQSGGGILVPFTAEAFADAMIDLLNNPGRAAEMGRNGREWVTKNRSYEVLARRVEERYLTLIQTEDSSESSCL